MANTRIVYNNVADKAALSGASQAGALVLGNLQTDMKSAVWRSNNTLTESIIMIWTASQTLNMVALPFCNLTSAATIRVRCYTLQGDASPAYDATTNACPGAVAASEWGGTSIGVNSYAYGGGTYAYAWFPQGSYQKVIVTLTDAANPAGYLEASRIVCGQYWSPTFTAEAGAAVNMVDRSKNERSDAGDLLTDRGTIHKTLTFDLNYLTSADRDKMFNVMRGNGIYKPVYVSLIPESTDTKDEQIFQIYGKVSKSGALRYQLQNQYSTQIEIEEI